MQGTARDNFDLLAYTRVLYCMKMNIFDKMDKKSVWHSYTKFMKLNR